MPQAILRRDLDDFILVSDDEIRAAMRLAVEKTRNLVEAAGAAPMGPPQALVGLAAQLWRHSWRRPDQKLIRSNIDDHRAR